MNNNSILSSFERVKQELENAIESLQDELRYVNKMIDNHSEGKQSVIPSEPENGLKIGSLNVPQVIRRIFEENPNKKFLPAKIRDKLEKMKDSGELKSTAKDLLTLTHANLKRMTENKEIIRINSKPYPEYKKITEE